MVLSTEPRVLVLDVETTPALAHVWQMFDVNVGLNQLVSPVDIVCFAAKWAGEDEVMFDSTWRNTKEGMLYNLWELMDEADAVVGWNSNRYDIRHINAHFVVQGLGPPSPYKKIDLMQVVRRHMKFMSNKLDYVAAALGVGRKLDTGGFELWLDVMRGDRDAQALMREYNEQDVLLTEEVYNKLRAWIQPAVNRSILEGHVCPECGSKHLQARGFRDTATRRYQRFYCNSCGSWSQSVASEKSPKAVLKKETI